jgi:hypothetical protein
MEDLYFPVSFCASFFDVLPDEQRGRWACDDCDNRNPDL